MEVVLDSLRKIDLDLKIYNNLMMYIWCTSLPTPSKKIGIYTLICVILTANLLSFIVDLLTMYPIALHYNNSTSILQESSLQEFAFPIKDLCSIAPQEYPSKQLHASS